MQKEVIHMSNIADIFSPETRFYRFFETVWELFALNILFILTSLPILTVGISATALCQSVQAMLRDEKPLSVYFSVWKTDWKQSTAVWVPMLGMLAALMAYYYLFVFVPEHPSFWVLLVLLVLTAVYLAVSAWLFSLMAQFSNTTANHVKNAAVLAVAHPVKSLIMAVLMLVPLTVMLISPYWFFRLGFIWIAAGASGVCWIHQKLIRPVMEVMIRKARKEAGLEEEAE